METIIGEGTEIRGDIQSTGVIRIDGFLEGKLEHHGDLVVGPTGRVRASIISRAMAIAGEVYGNLQVEGKLEILATGKLYGDIRCGNLVIHEGGVFAGHSQMTGQEAADPAPAAGPQDG